METKILKAVFGGGTSTVTNKRTRTDYGQVLEISGVDLPETFECIFSNSSTSAGVGKKMIGSSQRVLIPDEYLTTGQTIYAWILLHDSEDDGRHMYSVRIPVADMPDTSPEEPTPVEQSVISQAITALNSAVTTTTQKAQEATESADRAEQAADGVEGYAERAESAKQAAESARDRATQAETSARTSAATASEKASEAISSATTASQSALTAEGASESAQASADASYQNAQTAYRYAQDSATSAGQAGESEQTASQKASEASQKASEAAQSASTAVQAKTDAITAKTASQTAQGLAESARDEAVSAKTEAESARNEAQQIASGISGKAEQIDQNTADIASLEADRYKAYVTDTATGAVASFPDGADDVPMVDVKVQIEPVQDLSHGEPSPDNICPISGWTGVEVQRTGKNLLNTSNVKQGNRTSPTPANNVVTNGLMPIKGGETYVWNTALTDISGRYVGFHDADKHMFYEVNLYGAGVKTFTAPPNAVYFDALWYKTGGIVPADVATDIIELGSTATDYEPYQGNTYPITFPSEAGTIYGGYIDPINGELVVDRAIVDLGTLSWSTNSNNRAYIKDFTTAYGCAFPQSAYNVAGCVAEQYKEVPASGSLTLGTFAILQIKAIYFYYDGTNLPTGKMVFPLATPIHYPITPIEIKTLLGTNNIWANTGDTEVEYRADTKLYIERLTVPDSADMIADANIVSGQYFMVGNNLYRATVNIASGAQVIEGTNATKVSLATALNEINA